MRSQRADTAVVIAALMAWPLISAPARQTDVAILIRATGGDVVWVNETAVRASGIGALGLGVRGGTLGGTATLAWPAVAERVCWAGEKVVWMAGGAHCAIAR